MMRPAADIGTIMETREIPVISIRAPCEDNKWKWQVSYKENDFRIDWTRGKPKGTFLQALESALGVSFGEVEPAPAQPSTTSLEGLLG